MPRRLSFKVFAVAMAATLVSSQLFACSAVLLVVGGKPIVARNYDWHMGHALAMVNQPGISKRALSLDDPAEWLSKYGSVTINQYGRELPCEGINQAGLAITVLWLKNTEYPASDERPSVTSGQWVQYQLDTSRTVEDVIASDRDIRITPLGDAKVHYFVADATGDCAVIEFLEGEMVVHRGQSLPYPAITNSTYTESQAHYERQTAGVNHDGYTSDSLDRYATLAAMVDGQQAHGRRSPGAALRAVDAVRRDRSTRWQTVYDVEEKQLHFRTAEHRQLRSIDLNQLTFDRDQPVQILDLEERLSGDVTDKFRPYRPLDNRRLVERSFAETSFTRALPVGLLQMVIDYPEQWCHPAPLPAAAE